MKSFSFFNKIFFVALLISGCTYAPPTRNYVLAKQQYNLIKKANSVEFVIAKSVFDASASSNINLAKH